MIISHTKMSRLLQACTGCHKVATRLCNVIASSPQACSTLLQGRCLVLTSLLQGRHNCLVLTGLWQGCYKVVGFDKLLTGLLQGCYKVVGFVKLVTGLLQGCYEAVGFVKLVTSLLQACYWVATRLLWGCYKIVVNNCYEMLLWRVVVMLIAAFL